MPLRKRSLKFLSFPIRFQEYGLRTTAPPLQPSLAQNIPPVVVELKPGATPVSQKQYYLPHKAQVRIQNHLGLVTLPGTLPYY
jgi:hypothetical protein